MKEKNKKHDIDWYSIGCIAILVAIPIYIIISIICNLSMNNWDIRCIFTECKPVKIIGGEE